MPDLLNIDNLLNELLSICLIDKFLWGFGFFSFFTIYALFFLLVIDAFECSRLNEDEDFNTTSGFEYLYGLACDALKGIKLCFLSLCNNHEEPGSPVSVNAFPEMPTPSSIPGNLRTKSCITDAHKKALEEQDAKAVAALKLEQANHFLKVHPVNHDAVKADWINLNFHSVSEEMPSGPRCRARPRLNQVPDEVADAWRTYWLPYWLPYWLT